MLKLWSYIPDSKSGKALAEGLGIKRIKHEGSKYQPRPDDTIINWGASVLPLNLLKGPVILNDPEFVEIVSDKRMFFELMGDSKLVPPSTTDRERAVGWLRDGEEVVCRQVLRGHSGAGIVIANTEDEIVDAPLYVKYIKKMEEFRVHVSVDGVFDVQRKARRKDREDINWQIRTHDNGFIYQRDNLEDIEYLQNVKDIAFEVFDKTRLDFGAVDVLYNNYNDRCYVLEINTAPGLEGTTLKNYVNMLKELT